MVTEHGFDGVGVVRTDSHRTVVDVVDNLSEQQVNYQRIVQSLQWKQHLTVDIDCL